MRHYSQLDLREHAVLQQLQPPPTVGDNAYLSARLPSSLEFDDLNLTPRSEGDSEVSWNVNVQRDDDNAVNLNVPLDDATA